MEWFGYGMVMVMEWFGYGIVMVMEWFWYGYDYGMVLDRDYFGIALGSYVIYRNLFVDHTLW
jgi:hypothetical protein